MSRYFKRDGTQFTNVLEWATYFEAAHTDQAFWDREFRVAEHFLGDGIRISTVFLSLDHAFDDGPPVLFESMVFDGEEAVVMQRYHTEAEAIAGHDQLVAGIRDGRLDG